MGIQLTTDIVMDVVKAGNPARTQKITSNLKAIGSGFSQAMSQEGALGGVLGSANALAYAPTSAVGLQNATALTKTSAAGGPAATAHRKFESMVLSQFVQSMLPSKAAAVYGSGNAGQIWKSMLAEKVADQVAKHGGIGIADRIASAQARLTPSAATAAPSLPVASATNPAAAA